MSSVTGAMPNSDGFASRNKNPKLPNGRNAQRSSPRPHGPPSESNGALSDPEGFPDDEVVGARGTDRNRPRDPMAQAVPKVVDKVGEKVGEEFEKFLDQYVYLLLSLWAGRMDFLSPLLPIVVKANLAGSSRT